MVVDPVHERPKATTSTQSAWDSEELHQANKQGHAAWHSEAGHLHYLKKQMMKNGRKIGSDVERQDRRASLSVGNNVRA